MSAPMRVLAASAMLALAHAQGVILSAQGPNGPASLSLQVDPTKSDANIINKQEITQNAVNECGRTILGGNIDIGEVTENQLGNNTITKVTKGSTVDVTIAQVSSDGAGPYSCDLDLTSNSNGASGQTPLEVQEAQPQNGNIKLTVKMPADMACVGASTGDICTVRCFNANAKGPFGGCFAVQQTDVTPKQNTPDNIPTAATLKGVFAQTQQSAADLPAAIKSIQEAPTTDDQGVAGIKEILGSGVTQEAAGPADPNGNNGNNNNGNNNNANNGNNNNNNGNNNNANNGNNNNGNNNNNANNGNNNNGNNNNANNNNANNGNNNNGNNNNANNNNANNGNNNNGNNNNNANGLPVATIGNNNNNNGNGRNNNGNNNGNNNNNNNKRDSRDLRLRWARRNVGPRV
ncbi:hypothetical protein EsH8_I_000867 [Colletotrichum jinshuiense]